MTTRTGERPSASSTLTNERTIEVMLVLTTISIACMLYYIDVAKLAILNLFFLPIVLAGFFLGRYRAGILSLLSVLAAGILVSNDIDGFGGDMSPLTVALAVTVWAAVLGLTSILVGTLCDEKQMKTTEAHEAYVGVVEVLSRYLQSVNPFLENRSRRVAELSEQVANRMRLSPKEIDDIRVASLLQDMENIEITARVIRRAVGELEGDNGGSQPRTVAGVDLVRSLGGVLSGAFPLLVEPGQEIGAKMTQPFGAHIIQAVRAYLRMMDDTWAGEPRNSLEVIDELKCELDRPHHPAVLHALADVVRHEVEPSKDRLKLGKSTPTIVG